MSDHRQGKLTAGAILIVIGLAFFLAPRFDIFESEYLFLVMGLAFMAGYFVRRIYGLLVPGGILFGLGLGATLDDAFARWGDGDQIGLGLGFVLIYVIALVYQRRSHWWPLVPGGILIVSGIDKTQDVAYYLFKNWPLILVIVGVFLIFGSFRKGSRRAAAEE
ncbi:MAG: hypothetical protein ACE5GX_14585 [Thermoanaerobaculia bacterium]